MAVVSTSTSTDRNIILAMLALQVDLVSRDSLLAAIHAWSAAPNQSLLEILVEHGGLNPEDRVALEKLIPLGRVSTESRGHARRLRHLIEKSPVRMPADDTFLKGGEIARTVVAPSPPVPVPNAAPPNAYTTLAPETIENSVSEMRYRIVRLHRAGGLAEVFVATDAELRRQVALKQIKVSRADDAASRERFLVEAEITAALEHPSIIPIYGLGKYSDGRPYYAMRFIEGETLQEAIDHFHETDQRPGAFRGERGLELRKLLGRFIAVCEAVDYAHSRGVLHRDLKPTNIMLGSYGETLVVDWGLAKAFHLPDTHIDRRNGSTVAMPAGLGSDTVMGSTIGTPQYMSPEQAQGRLDQLGPASDIYSLGATLYCILVGRPPYGHLDDIESVLRSARIGVFQKPREIKREIPPHLEAICLKAMAYDPADRYKTARVMLSDLEHWLADEPVLAAPESRLYRFGRMVRRHRTAALAIVISTIILTFAGGWTYLEEGHTRAVQKEADRALGAIESVFNVVSSDDVLDEKSLQPVRTALIHYYSDYLLERADNTAAQLRLANINSRMAGMTNVVGSKSDALKYLDQAQEIYAQLIERDPRNADYGSKQANVYIEQGMLLFDLRKFSEAEHCYKTAATEFQNVLKEDSNNLEARQHLAQIYHNQGILENARGEYERSNELLEKGRSLRHELLHSVPDNAVYKRDLAISYGYLGDSELQLGRDSRAKFAYDESERYRRELVEQRPRDFDARFQLARSYENSAEFYRRKRHAKNQEQADLEQAAEFYKKSRDLRQDLVQEKPANSKYRSDLGWALLGLGKLQVYLKQPDEALVSLRASMKAFEELIKGDPDDKTALSPHAAAMVATAALLLDRGGEGDAARLQKAEAKKLLDNAAEEFELLKGRDQADDLYNQAALFALRLEMDPSEMVMGAKSVALLEIAIRQGFSDRLHLERDRAFKSVRTDPRFEAALWGLQK